MIFQVFKVSDVSGVGGEHSDVSGVGGEHSDISGV